MLKKEVAEKLPADLDGLAATLVRLQGLLERAHAYCDDVVVRWPAVTHCPCFKDLYCFSPSAWVWFCRAQTPHPMLQEGRRKGDVVLGRYLADTVTGIPRFGAAEMQEVLMNSAQDSMLVMYLGNLVRAHLALADRLGTASLPLL